MAPPLGLFRVCSPQSSLPLTTAAIVDVPMVSDERPLLPVGQTLDAAAHHHLV